MISLKRNETLGDFLRRLGLEIDDFAKELKENRIGKNDTLDKIDLENFFEKYRDKMQKKIIA